MRSLVFAIAVFLSLPALAGDAVDQALMDLGADESEKRDAAEKLLWNADGTAWERAKTVLEKSSDAEVKARLGPIVDWLAVQAKSSALVGIWKDRWFLVHDGPELVGVEHQAAELKEEAGAREWVFTNESSYLDREPEPQDLRLVLRAHNDLRLSPIAADWEILSGPIPVQARFSWIGLDLDIQVLSGAIEVSEGRLFKAGFKRTLPIANETSDPVTPSVLLAEILERAALARVSPVKVVVHNFLAQPFDGTELYEARFACVEMVPYAGKRIETRRYDHGSDLAGPQASYWISDTEGLVRAVVSGMEATRVDEATARAAGLDAVSRAEVRAVRLQEALGSEDAEERANAEEGLLSYPDAAARVADALKRATSPRAKERLEAMARWLDPEFGAAELAATWKDRWLVVKEGPKIVGVEHQSCTAGDAGGHATWNFVSDADGTEAGDVPYHTRLVLAAKRDCRISPIEADWSVRGTFASRLRMTWEGGGCRFQVLAGSPPVDRDRSRRGRGGRPGSQVPPTPDFLECEVVERASLARIERFRLMLEIPLGGRTAGLPVVARFRGTEKVTFQGSELDARHYVLSLEGGAVRSEYWVADSVGVLRGIVDTLLFERSDRATAVASGLDPASRREAAALKALENLAAADEVSRDKAEASLLDLPEARTRVLAALKEGAEGERRERLERIARWLDPEFSRKELAALWGERYFGYVSGGKQIGAERLGAAPGAEPSTLDWSGEGGFIDGRVQQRARWTARTRFDAFLTPVEADIRGSNDERSSYAWNCWWDGDVPIVKGSNGRWRGRARASATAGLAPPTLDVLATCLVERASLARLKSVGLTVCLFGDQAAEALKSIRLEFAGEEPIEAGGATVQARHYLCASGPGGRREEYWLTDAQGLVRMTCEDYVVTRIEREAWLATGIDELEAHLKKMREAMAQLANPNDRVEAIAKLQSMPEMLPALRTALAAEKDGKLRSTLQSLCNWLDPAFGNDALAALPRDEWVRYTDGGAPAGWEHRRIQPDPAHGPRAWKVTSRKVTETGQPGRDFEFAIEVPSLVHPPDFRFTLTGASEEDEFNAVLEVSNGIITIHSSGSGGDDGEEVSMLEVAGTEETVTLAALVPVLVVRASLARLDVVEVNEWDIPHEWAPKLQRFEFKAEEKVKLPGGEVTARRYSLAGAPPGAEREFWITDKGGIVKSSEAGKVGIVTTEAEATK